MCLLTVYGMVVITITIMMGMEMGMGRGIRFSTLAGLHAVLS